MRPNPRKEAREQTAPPVRQVAAAAARADLAQDLALDHRQHRLGQAERRRRAGRAARVSAEPLRDFTYKMFMQSLGALSTINRFTAFDVNPAREGEARAWAT